MLNYRKQQDFNKIVFIINDDQEIEEHNYGSLCRECADETCSPRGAEPRFHVRGNELWTWGPGGQNPVLVEEFETEAEAEHALLISFEYDLHNTDDAPIVFYTRADAEAELALLINGD